MNPFRDSSIRWRLGVLLGIILLFILMNIGGTWWFLQAQADDGRAINVAGEQRMLSQQMTWQAHQIGMGDDELIPDLKASANAFDQNLADLTEGNPERGIPEPPDSVAAELDEVREQWTPFYEALMTVAETSSDTTESTEAIHYIEEHNRELLVTSDGVVNTYEAAFDSKVNRFQHFIVVILIIDSILIPTLFVMTDRHVLRPIRSIARDTQQVAAGDLDHDIAVFDSDDEVGWMSQSVRAMHGQLVDTIGEHRRFKHAIEHAGHAIYITDVDGQIEYVNPSFERITGFCAEEVLGQTPRLFNSGHQSAEYYAELWETIASGEVWEEEVINTRATGQYFNAEQTIAPILDADGETVAYVAIMSDQTVRNLREQQNKVFGRVLRHNLRTELTIINGYTEQLVEAGEDPDERQAYKHRIRESIGNLLELSQKADTSVKLLREKNNQFEQPACEALEHVTDHLADTYDEVTIEVDIPETEYQLPTMVEVIYYELIENAIIHNDRDEPVVTVVMRTVERQNQFPTILIDIYDNGPGIDELERDVIESGDESALYHGSGLGLWLVYWATTYAGGQIDIEVTDAGTCIMLTLPAIGDRSTPNGDGHDTSSSEFATNSSNPTAQGQPPET